MRVSNDDKQGGMYDGVCKWYRESGRCVCCMLIDASDVYMQEMLDGCERAAQMREHQRKGMSDRMG